MTPVRALSALTDFQGVGPKVAEALGRLGICAPKDLLFHLPTRYEDRTQKHNLNAVTLGEPQLLEGTITAHQVIPGRRTQALLTFEDHTGVARIRLFHFSRAYLDSLTRAHCVRVFGEPRMQQGILELIHPEIMMFRGEPPALTDQLTPIYPTTEGLAQAKLRDVIKQAIARGPEAYQLEELLDASWLVGRPPLWDALVAVHQPAKCHPPSESIARLAFEELLAHRLLLLTRREQYGQLKARQVTTDGATPRQQLLQSLPFRLTDAQHRVLAEIDADLTRNQPMLRLLQGDVGSGKTLVAALAALPVLLSGHQVALMAPTELLAEQHAQQFVTWFAPLGIDVGWLSGSLTTAARRPILGRLAEGACRMVIGTHALFQSDVQFAALGLVIIDEQHRFGVAQRLLLREKGQGVTPHQLIMTATPIPRTLAMTQYADLDVSVIDGLPPGRTPVETRVLSQQRSHEVTQRIDQQLNAGGQAYWVCTLIEDNEQGLAEAAESRLAKLQEWLPHRRIGLVHGRLKASEKQQIMAEFANGQLDILVATTVIEVGVNVPNANIMIIENPERLGLAQLHQLRGRVGRGQRISYCLLLAGDPLSAIAKARLSLLKSTHDGFALAEADLRLRGPGDVSGTRQTGDLVFRVADLAVHGELLDEVAQVAEHIRATSLHQRHALIARWVGTEEHFAHV